METQKTHNSQHNQEEKNNTGNLILPDFKACYKQAINRIYGWKEDKQNLIQHRAQKQVPIRISKLLDKGAQTE